MKKAPEIFLRIQVFGMRAVRHAAFTALLLSGPSVGAQHTDLRRGDRLYDRQDYAGAEQRYREAQNATGRYNAGNAAFRQGQFAEAAALFQEAANTAKGSEAKADAWYNQGNALFQAARYREAVSAYEKSLRLLPNREDAKRNLRIARDRMRDQPEPPPPPPPPPPARRPPPRHQYVDQGKAPAKKETVQGGMQPETARRLLEEWVDGQEAEHARQYRELAPAVRPVKGKKDW